MDRSLDGLERNKKIQDIMAGRVELPAPIDGNEDRDGTDEGDATAHAERIAEDGDVADDTPDEGDSTTLSARTTSVQTVKGDLIALAGYPSQNTFMRQLCAPPPSRLRNHRP